MNQAAALAFEQSKKFGGIRQLLGLIGLPSKAAAKELPEAAVQVLYGVKEVLDGLLLRAIAKRTGAEFDTTRDAVFGDYFAATMSLSKLASVIIPPATIDRLSWESFSELEAQLKHEGLTRFGASARDQALFTVWTKRKIKALAQQIASAPELSAEFKAQDEKIISEFIFYSTWSQFHFDCLVASMRFDQPIHPEVLDKICDGLRGAVNAYGLISQGLDLRLESIEPTIAPPVWDEEDQELLDSSMREMESESL
jgi:hypothetical protein